MAAFSSFFIFFQNKSDISKISTKYSCDLQVFPLKCIGRNSKIRCTATISISMLFHFLFIAAGQLITGRGFPLVQQLDLLHLCFYKCSSVQVFDQILAKASLD